MARTNRPKGEGSLYQHTDGRWMYSIMHEGRRLTKSLGTRAPEEAQREYLKVRNRFAGQIDRRELAPTIVKSFTIGEILIRYSTYPEENERKSTDIARLVVGLIQRDAHSDRSEKSRASRLPTLKTTVSAPSREA